MRIGLLALLFVVVAALLVALLATYKLNAAYENTLALVAQQQQALATAQATIQKLASSTSSSSSTAVTIVAPSPPAARSNLDAQAIASLKSRCGDTARQYFNAGNYLGSGVGRSTYSDHYSTSKDACFIQITTNAPTYVLVELDDADEATMIGMVSADFDSATGQEGAVRSCVTSPQMNNHGNTCSSVEEFLKLAHAYIYP